MSSKPATLIDLDSIDRLLLGDIQLNFPIEHRPFGVLSQKLGISEEECLDRIANLKKRQMIRQISAIFDTKSLGYQSALIAMRIEKSRIDEVAQSLNSHPGISHNYQRNDVFNLWFTLAVPPTESIEKTFEALKSQADAEEALFLPAIHIYKIGVKFELDEELPDLESEQLTYVRNNKGSGKISLTKTDIALIRVMQEDLPVIEMPFAVLAEQAGLSEEELFNWSKHALQTGLMRRFCAVLYHRNVGMKANAMVVWRVPEENTNSVGEEIAKFRQVSHCYRRPTSDLWPYSIFSMIHGSDEAECFKIISQIEQKIGSFPHKVLLSVKEYKKVRIKYFDPEFDAWRSRFSDKASKNERRRK